MEECVFTRVKLEDILKDDKSFKEFISGLYCRNYSGWGIYYINPKAKLFSKHTKSIAIIVTSIDFDPNQEIKNKYMDLLNFIMQSLDAGCKCKTSVTYSIGENCYKIFIKNDKPFIENSNYDVLHITVPDKEYHTIFHKLVALINKFFTLERKDDIIENKKWDIPMAKDVREQRIDKSYDGYIKYLIETIKSNILNKEYSNSLEVAHCVSAIVYREDKREIRLKTNILKTKLKDLVDFYGYIVEIRENENHEVEWVSVIIPKEDEEPKFRISHFVV